MVFNMYLTMLNCQEVSCAYQRNTEEGWCPLYNPEDAITHLWDGSLSCAWNNNISFLLLLKSYCNFFVT